MRSVLRLSSLASALVGVAYLLSALAFLIQPSVLRGAGSRHELWLVLGEGSLPHLAVHWLSSAAGVLGLAVVPGALRLVRSHSEGLALWASALAYLGFAVTARSHLMEVEFDLRVAPLYSALSGDTQAAVPLIAGLALDTPHGFLTFGGVGFWILVISSLGYRSQQIPRIAAYIGYAAATSFLAGVVGFSLALRPLATLGIGLGGLILVPAWFVWLGLVLHRKAQHSLGPGRIENDVTDADR